jgi:hypothetical protein
MTSRYGNLSKLLEGTHEAAYWLGFIMADGSFSGNRLGIGLHPKDSTHLESFKSWAEITSPILLHDQGRYVKISIMDSTNVPKLRELYDIQPRKTYNPPKKLPFQSPELNKSFLVGLIDGDGYITRQTGRDVSAILIVGHLSWLSFFQKLSESTGFGKTRTRPGSVDSTGTFAALNSHVHGNNVTLKLHAIKHDLPYLSRKWSLVDESVLSDKYVRAEKLKDFILSGKTNSEIYQIYKISEAGLSMARKRLDVDLLGNPKII